MTPMWEPDALVLEGRFKILRPLGRGGVTEVYLAEQVSLSRKVVLKLLRRELGIAEGMAQRFEDEVKRLASVNHPAVVRVIDFGASGELLYLVTEVAEGQPLRSALDGEPMMPDRAVAILQQLAEGLSAIHEQGLLHRDLRPDNIFLHATPRGERARLIDFGLSRLVDPDPGQPRVTLLLSPVGQPQYMSPEQARGAPTDALSDLCSLGVIAYQLLSGRLPYAGPTAVDYAAQRQQQRPTPLAEAAPHLADHLRLCELVMRCLEKDPALRPASALELAQRLTSLPSVGEPTLLVEALQKLPPALPERPKEPAFVAAPPPSFAIPHSPAGAAPTPEKPRAELLPSVQLPVWTAEQPSVDKPARSQVLPLPTRARIFVAVAGVGLCGLIVLIGTALVPSAASSARSRIEGGRGAEALAIIDEALREKSRSDPELLALKAAALHLVDQHREEAAVFRDQLAPKAPEALSPLAVGGLVADFGRKEDGATRDLLRRLPREGLHPVLAELAKGARSPRQWGALRYLDAEQATSELDLVRLYTSALEAELCSTRRFAARRLGQLGDADAEEALAKLKATPRSATPEKNCGQDEASWALQALRRKAEK